MQNESREQFWEAIFQNDTDNNSLLTSVRVYISYHIWLENNIVKCMFPALLVIGTSRYFSSTVTSTPQIFLHR